jgi:hypothetical protein
MLFCSWTSRLEKLSRFGSGGRSSLRSDNIYTVQIPAHSDRFGGHVTAGGDSGTDTSSVEATEDAAGHTAPEVVQKELPTKMPQNGSQSVGDVSKEILAQSRRGRELGGEGLWEVDDSSGAANGKRNILSPQFVGQLRGIETAQRRSDQRAASSGKASEWDMMLDQGKVKKVKTKDTEKAYNGVSPFQRQQDHNNRFRGNEDDGLENKFSMKKRKLNESAGNSNSKPSDEWEEVYDSRSRPNNGNGEKVFKKQFRG